MIENLIGKRYAEALSSSIDDDVRINSALNNLEAILEAFRVEPRLTAFFAHPAIAIIKKKDLMNDLCEQIEAQPEVVKLLSILIERGKILSLKNVTGYFQNFVDERLNRIRANVISAMPLNEIQTQRFIKELNKILDKEIMIEASVDESLLGGILVKIGDLIADASVKNRLATMKRFIEKEEVVSELASR